MNTKTAIAGEKYEDKNLYIRSIQKRTEHQLTLSHSISTSFYDFEFKLYASRISRPCLLPVKSRQLISETRECRMRDRKQEDVCDPWLWLFVGRLSVTMCEYESLCRRQKQKQYQIISSFSPAPHFRSVEKQSDSQAGGSSIQSSEQ